MSTNKNVLLWSLAAIKEPVTVPCMKDLDKSTGFLSERAGVVIKDNDNFAKGPVDDGSDGEDDDDDDDDDDDGTTSGDEIMNDTGEAERKRDKYCSKCGMRLGADFVCHNGGGC